MKQRSRKIIYPVLLLLALYFLGGLILSNRQNTLVYRPHILDSGYHFDISSSKEFNIRVNDSESLNILYLTAADSARGQVLFFHDYDGNISDYLPQVKIYLKNHYRVFMIDYPGYGKSTGKPSEKALYESANILFQLASKYEPEDRTVVAGVGLGSGVAAYLSSRHSFRELILLNPFYSLPSLAKRILPIYPTKNMEEKYPVYHYIGRSAAPVTILQSTTSGHRSFFKEGLKLSRKLRPADQFKPIPQSSYKDYYTHPIFIKTIEDLLKP